MISIERLGLADRAGEAVEDEAAVGVSSLVEPLVDDADHDVVGHAARPRPCISLALRPNSVPSLTAARSMSPVEMCGHDVVARQPDALRALARSLPAEDARAARRGSDGPSLQEALVVAHHQLAVDLLHRLEGDADGDEDDGAAERERWLHVAERRARSTGGGR